MTDDSLLARLAEEFTAEMRAGKPADIEAYARKYPKLAERIRELFPTLMMLEGKNLEIKAPERMNNIINKQRTLSTLFSLYLVSIGFAAGCGHHSAQVVRIQQNEITPISFLKDGQTSKDEAISRLGERKIGEFENFRILIFALDKKYQIASSDDKVRYHLTLVFDEIDGQILKKHSLVRIR